jgi:hypothetical protein
MLDVYSCLPEAAQIQPQHCNKTLQHVRLRIQCARFRGQRLGGERWMARRRRDRGSSANCKATRGRVAARMIVPVLAPMRGRGWLAQARCVASGVCALAAHHCRGHARSIQHTIVRTIRQRCVRDSGGCRCDESSERRVPLGQKQSAALVSPKPNPTSQPGRNAAAVNGRPQRREERLDSTRQRLRPRRATGIAPARAVTD